MDNKKILITLNLPLSLEETMLDFLLNFEIEHGFSGFPVSRYHYKNETLSIAEQVVGKQQKICFQIIMVEQKLATLLKRLKSDFSGANIDYCVLPVIDNGFI